jgi:hypothetical protein
MSIEPQQPAVYEIHVQGRLHSSWSSWFDGMTLIDLPGGITALVGPVIDQAALFGVLSRIRDLGAALISVQRLDS